MCSVSMAAMLELKVAETISGVVSVVVMSGLVIVMTGQMVGIFGTTIGIICSILLAGILEERFTKAAKRRKYSCNVVKGPVFLKGMPAFPTNFPIPAYSHLVIRKFVL